MAASGCKWLWMIDNLALQNCPCWLTANEWQFGPAFCVQRARKQALTLEQLLAFRRMSDPMFMMQMKEEWKSHRSQELQECVFCVMYTQMKEKQGISYNWYTHQHLHLSCLQFEVWRMEVDGRSWIILVFLLNIHVLSGRQDGICGIALKSTLTSYHSGSAPVGYR